MAAVDLSITKDVIDQSGSSQQYNGLGVLVNANIRRVLTISGLNQYSTTATAIADAETRAKIEVPQGTASAQQPLATSRGYDVVPNSLSDDSVQVVVSYIYAQIGWDATQWTIETDSFAELVETDSEYNVSSGSSTPTVSNGGIIPITVSNYYRHWDYASDNTPPPVADVSSATEGKIDLTTVTLVAQKPLPPAYASCGVYKPRKRLIMTRTIYSASDFSNLQNIADQFIGTLNNAAFQGKPAGTWLCLDIDLTIQPYAGSRLARMEFVWRLEGWMPWVRFSNRELGVPPNIFKFAKNGAAGNGMRQANVYLGNDFAYLVANLNGNAATPFPTGAIPASY